MKANLFDPELFGKQILPIDKFCPFETINGKKTKFPSKRSKTGKIVIEKAEKLLDYEMKVLPLSQYIRFTGDGNRTGYESPYFERRNNLNLLVLAELCEKEGRFIPKIMDILFAICEESTWVVPAHNYSVKNHHKPFIAQMPEPVGEDIWAIDLFSAATGAIVALCRYFFCDEFEKRIPELFNDRLYYELNRRIIKPYLNTTELWWMGYTRGLVNNWNIWINHNVLTVCAFAVKDMRVRQALARKIAESANYYYNSMPDDGGCDEGPSYWGAAGACLASFAELGFSVTGGKYNVFGDKKFENIVDYIRKVHISGKYFVNCADGHPRMSINGSLIRRMGKLFCNEKLYAFGNEAVKNYRNIATFGYRSPYCNLTTVLDMEYDKNAGEYVPETHEYFPDLQLAMIREKSDTKKGFFLAAKGGHNAESHNHLDVGNFIVFYNGKPVIIDAGVGTYTRFTFDINYRYTMFAFRTEDHTLPLINGKGQWIEKEHHADNFSINENKTGISVELREAYLNKDEIESFERKLDVGDGEINLSDRIVLKKPGNAEFFIPVYNRPEKIGDNKYKLSDDVYITFSDGFDIAVEKIRFEVESFVLDWEKEEIYKFCIRSKDNISEIVLDAKITHAI